jgi:hypothetical protein
VPLVVYTLSALALLWLTHRYVCRLSKAAGALLFFAPFVFVGYALIAGRVYAPIDKVYADEPLRSVRAEYGIGDPHNPVTTDIVSQMIPWRHAVREAYARGEWPLWNPYILSGDILAAASQPAPYSPFTLLALLMPAALSFTFTAAITFFLAAAGAFVFTRDLGCRETASAIAGLGFVYSSCLALYVLWPLGLSWALLPWVFVGTRRIVVAPSIASWALLTSAFTLLLLAGHGESALHIVALAALYGVFELLSVRRRIIAAIVCAVAAGGVALLLSAIHLLPHLEVLPQTAEYFTRSMWRRDVHVAPTASVLASLAANFFPFLHLQQWIDPAVPGMKAETAAAGSIVVALAVYAVWRVRSRTTWFFAALAAFCFAAHAGWWPVGRLLSRLPLFDLALNDRLAFGAAFAMAVLAALAAEEIARRDDRRAAMLTLLAVLVVLAAGTLWISRAFVLDAGWVQWGRYKTPAELVLLGVAVLLFATRIRMPVAIGALVVLLAVQRGVSEGGVHRSFPQRAAYPRTEIFEPLAGARTPFRIVGHGWSLMPGTSALYGLEDVRGYEAMTFAPYVESYRIWCEPQNVFFNRVDDLSKPFLSMMNVRYAFGDACTPVPPGWTLVKQQGNAVLLKNTNVIERAFVPEVVRLHPDRTAILNAMAKETDFRRRAWIESGWDAREGTNGPGRVSIRRIRGGYAIDADMQAPGYVIVSEENWKGWRATIDGEPAILQPANAAFIGIYAPKGKHSIRLVYLPEAFVKGRWISFATLLALIAGFGVRWRTKAAAMPPHSYTFPP